MPSNVDLRIRAEHLIRLCSTTLIFCTITHARTHTHTHTHTWYDTITMLIARSQAEPQFNLPHYARNRTRLAKLIENRSRQQRQSDPWLFYHFWSSSCNFYDLEWPTRSLTYSKPLLLEFLVQFWNSCDQFSFSSDTACRGVSLRYLSYLGLY